MVDDGERDWCTIQVWAILPGLTEAEATGVEIAVEQVLHDLGRAESIGARIGGPYPDRDTATAAMQVNDEMVEAAALVLLPRISSWDHVRKADRSVLLDGFKPSVREALQAAVTVKERPEGGTCPACKRSYGNSTTRCSRNGSAPEAWCEVYGRVDALSGKAV